jgi:hypothetical protein
MHMHEAGTRLADIRAAIERKYAPNFSTMTPTAPVPK